MIVSTIKKYILLAVALISTEILADNFYLKGGIGLNHIYPFKVHENESKAKTTQNFPLLETGIGYNFSDQVRVELVFDYLFMFNIKETLNSDYIIADITRKTKIHGLFLNSTLDIIKFKETSIFLGGGVGNSFHKESIESLAITYDDYGRFNNIEEKTNQFAYKITVGVDFKLRNDLNLELAYNYFDLGKNRAGFRYKINNVTLGLRYAL